MNDFLDDFEHELREAAKRKKGTAPFFRAGPLVAAAAAAAAVIAVLVVALIGGAGAPDIEVPAGAPEPTPAGGKTTEVQLGAFGIRRGCYSPRQRDFELERSIIRDRMGIFRRRQHSPDAAATAEVQSIPATDYDFLATRSPTGIGERVLLSPARRVNPPCEENATSGATPGVCLIVREGSRCFDWAAIEAGQAVALTPAGKLIGMVFDGVERVILEANGQQVEATVVENVYAAHAPLAERGTLVKVTLVERSTEGCEPSREMRTAVPVLMRSPNEGGVPKAVRTFRGPRDSAVIAEHARIAGGGDGITYWVVPWLKCDDPSTDADRVCVYPVFEQYADQAGGGGSACATLVEIRKGGTWIHFPTGSRAAVAGLAPPGAKSAIARIEQADIAQQFPVIDGVWAGTFEGYELEGEVGGLEVEFDIPEASDSPPRVAVLNGTTTLDQATRVMDALARVNYRRGATGNWIAQNVRRSIVFHQAGKEWLGKRIAVYLGEHFRTDLPEVQEMTPDAQGLAGQDAEALVVVGEDLAK